MNYSFSQFELPKPSVLLVLLRTVLWLPFAFGLLLFLCLLLIPWAVTVEGVLALSVWTAHGRVEGDPWSMSRQARGWVVQLLRSFPLLELRR